MRKSVLFISSSADDANAVSRMLVGIASSCERVPTLSTARQKLEAGTFGAVLTDVHLEDGTWLDVVRLAGQAGHGPAVIVANELADTRFWLDALDLGAYDVLSKPFYRDEVQWTMANALHEPPRLMGSMPVA